MIRAIKLEWLKVKNYRVFWVLLSMYLAALIVICFGGTFLLEWLKSKGAEFEGLDPTILPIYDFPDIWQNTTYLGSFIKIFLAFIVIISVNNDLSYNTLRQNIIDGISKKEYLISKLLFIVGLAVLSTVFLFVSGLINGSLYSHVWGMEYIFDELEFLVAYVYDIFIYCVLAFLLSLLIKKTGFIIIALMLYTFMFEPIVTSMMIYAPFMRDGVWPHLAPFFPIYALNNLIPIPYPKYIFQEVETNVAISSILISTGWLAIFLSWIIFILNKRDLK